ncbi:hypothetical protein [Mesorhizobium sp.]|uniref:hypothetical protein n=1 Tax=Mesorhizobium sp. TaxID=1871066 RepID=UPI000FE6A884|nr:hypothetical protein [Mesorhizobium sp.]RWB29612.1 MAG: hypothetical protein EOQ41_15985 [Mesorhizobium sp.]RWE96451.1 MAG: hypothetical protein EOS43_22375 [Mesorhizobium sp.]
MTRDFLPEYSQMPVGSRYRPLFRLFAGSGWKYVRKDGAPVECDTASQAIEAAKECVKRILNPEIRAEQAAVIEDVLGVEAWQRERAGQAARDQQDAFGALIVRGRQILVEKRRQRA